MTPRQEIEQLRKRVAYLEGEIERLNGLDLAYRCMVKGWMKILRLLP